MTTTTPAIHEYRLPVVRERDAAPAPAVRSEPPDAQRPDATQRGLVAASLLRCPAGR